MTEKNKLVNSDYIEDALWGLEALCVGLREETVITRRGKYNYSIGFERSHIDRWVEEQKEKYETFSNYAKRKKT